MYSGASSLDGAEIRDLSLSSAATITSGVKRGTDGPDVIQLQDLLSEPIEVATTVNWIKLRRLDGLVVFNGRMDLTAAVIKAAKDYDVDLLHMKELGLGMGLNYPRE